VNRTTKHPRRRLTISTVAALATLSLVAAACGDDDDAPAATNAPATAAPEPTADEMTEMSSEMSSDEMTEMSSEMSSDEMTEMSSEMTGDEMMAEPFGPACSAVPADGEGSFSGMADDPAATAAGNNPVLSTLVTAVVQAGLVDTLNSEGPFTIFAPTNDAFAALPPADLEAVLADNDLLASVLTYHVIAGQSLSAAELAEAGELETVNGATLTFDTDGTTVNGIDVVCSDVHTGNATVHIISGVLLPG
jgi:transforming growth factor-beta-induced protein